MSFVTVKGWALPIAPGSDSFARSSVGELGVSVNNRATRRRRGRPDRWPMTVRLAGAKVADTVEGLVSGRGHHWPCDDDAFSDRGGVGPELGSAYTIVESVADAQFGHGYLDVVGTVTWDVGLRTGKYVIGYWRDLLGTPEHVWVRSDGDKWSDGVKGAVATAELSVVAPRFALGAGQYDDVVFLPFYASDDFLEASHAWMVAEDRPFSPLPFLVMQGDIVDGGERLVRGEVNQGTYIGRGAKTGEAGGWKTNARDVPIAFDEEIDRELDRALDWFALWLLDTRYLTGSALRAAAGTYAGTKVGGTTGQPGPFGLGESWEYDGAAAAQVDLPSLLAEAIDGASVVSVAAWVRRDSIDSDHNVLSLTVSGATVKLVLTIEAGNLVLVEARSQGADGLQLAFGTTVMSDLVNFHLIGGVIDVENDSIEVWLDGELESTTAVTFGADKFEGGAGTEQRIARGAAGGDRLDGDVASVGLVRRRVLAAEWRRMVKLGKEGVLR